MAFLNPFFLLGALTLAVPVLIHLVRREKSEIVPFSSLMFLLKVPKRAIRQQKLKNLLLMALRLLILALLVSAFARPYVTQSATPEAPTGDERGYVLMLDNSYSMRYGTNFDRMKAEATQRIDSMASGDQMALVAFNDAATVLSMPTSDKNELKAKVQALEPSFGGTRFYEAFGVAARLLGELGGQKNLVVISDFQRAGWNRSSRESVIGTDVQTEVVSLAVDQPANVGIESVAVEPATTFSRTYSGRVIARIRNYQKDRAVSVPVSIAINDRETERRTINVAANSTSLAEFTGFDVVLGSTKGKVRIETADSLATDNEFLFSLERRDKLKVLIMDAGRAQQSLYLEKALTSSTADLPFEITVARADSVDASDLANYNVVLVNDVPRLTENQRARMEELRKTGQGQLVILAENADLGWWGGSESFPVRATQKVFVQKDRGQPSYSLTTYDRNHGIFKPFQNSTRFALNTAKFFAYTEVQPKPGASVLAKFENGSPALVESSAEDRGLLVLSSAVNNPLQGWNDLVLRPSFVPLLHETIRYLSQYNEVRGWYALGDGIPITGSIETAAAAVVKPDGERQALGDLAPGDQRFFSPTMPGFHELRVGRDLRVVAVNPPAGEGNLEPMLPEDLLASVQSTEGETQRAGLFGTDETDDYARRQMGWWYLLLIALLAGIVEIYIANKSQRTQAETVRL